MCAAYTTMYVASALTWTNDLGKQFDVGSSDVYNDFVLERCVTTVTTAHVCKCTTHV